MEVKAKLEGVRRKLQKLHGRFRMMKNIALEYHERLRREEKRLVDSIVRHGAPIASTSSNTPYSPHDFNSHPELSPITEDPQECFTEREQYNMMTDSSSTIGEEEQRVEEEEQEQAHEQVDEQLYQCENEGFIGKYLEKAQLQQQQKQQQQPEHCDEEHVSTNSDSMWSEDSDSDDFWNCDELHAWLSKVDGATKRPAEDDAVNVCEPQHKKAKLRVSEEEGVVLSDTEHTQVGMGSQQEENQDTNSSAEDEHQPSSNDPTSTQHHHHHQQQQQQSQQSSQQGNTSSSEEEEVKDNPLDLGTEYVPFTVGEDVRKLYKVKDKSNRFILEKMQTKSFRQKTAIEITYKSRLEHPYDNVPIQSLDQALLALFETILRSVRRRTKVKGDVLFDQKSLIRIFITHDDLPAPIVFLPKFVGSVTAEMILNEVMRHLTSANSIMADGKLVINVATVRIPSGKAANMTNRAQVIRRRCMLAIRNTDHLCLPRAIAVAKARLNYFNAREDGKVSPQSIVTLRKQFDKLRNSKLNNKAQKQAAETLVQKAGLKGEQVGLLTSIPAYEAATHMRIVVISMTTMNAPMYSGNMVYKDIVHLFHSEVDGVKHFDVITKMTGFANTPYYCTSCLVGYNKRGGHVCESTCGVCGRKKCFETDSVVKCTLCNKTCRSAACFKAHQEKPESTKGRQFSSMCEKNKLCVHCGVCLKFRKQEHHICGESFCAICEKFHIEDRRHQCFMRSKAPTFIPNKLIFYDFESMQVNGIHEPNLVVAQTSCHLCEDEENVSAESQCAGCGRRCFHCSAWDKRNKQFKRPPCDSCGHRQVVFKGKDTVSLFCEWLLSAQNRDSTVIAHNSKAYDCYFIFKYMVDHGIKPHTVLFSGSKIMYMKVGKGAHLRFLDSLNFLPMALAKLPKAFGFSELRKGYFPHLFNTPENQHVVLSHLPDAGYYSPDEMIREKRQKFLEWYAKNQNNTFHFQDELLSYCVSDVDILRKSCLKFRQLLKQETDLDPFSFITIAAVCLGVFRYKFLPEKWKVLLKFNASPHCTHPDLGCKCQWSEGRKLTASSVIEVLYNGNWVSTEKMNIAKKKFESSILASLPNTPPLGGDMYSLQAIEWLYSEERSKGINIQSAVSEQGEKIVPVTFNGKLIKYRLDGYSCIEGEPVAFEFYGCSFHGCPNCFQVNREKTLHRGKSIAQ